MTSTASFEFSQQSIGFSIPKTAQVWNLCGLIDFWESPQLDVHTLQEKTAEFWAKLRQARIDHTRSQTWLKNPLFSGCFNGKLMYKWWIDVDCPARHVSLPEGNQSGSGLCRHCGHQGISPSFCGFCWWESQFCWSYPPLMFWSPNLVLIFRCFWDKMPGYWG